MSLIDELRGDDLYNLLVETFKIISEYGEEKKNKEVLNKIISKYKNKKGECTFCGNKLK